MQVCLAFGHLRVTCLGSSICSILPRYTCFMACIALLAGSQPITMVLTQPVTVSLGLLSLVSLAGAPSWDPHPCICTPSIGPPPVCSYMALIMVLCGFSAMRATCPSCKVVFASFVSQYTAIEVSPIAVSRQLCPAATHIWNRKFCFLSNLPSRAMF